MFRIPPQDRHDILGQRAICSASQRITALGLGAGDRVYTLDERIKRWRETRIHQGDVAVRAAPFDAIELDLSVLWSPPRPG